MDKNNNNNNKQNKVTFSCVKDWCDDLANGRTYPTSNAGTDHLLALLFTDWKRDEKRAKKQMVKFIERKNTALNKHQYPQNAKPLYRRHFNYIFQLITSGTVFVLGNDTGLKNTLSRFASKWSKSNVWNATDVKS
eukprot:897306_1